jgi:AcrR family transcriptional regulator
LRAAAKLILKNGFTETSVQEIASATGIGKSTFYEFFSSKNEVILLLLDEPLAEVRRKAETIAGENVSAWERITQILHMHLEILLRDKAFIFRLFFEFQRLPLEVQAQHEVKRKAYQDLLINLIEEGIREKNIRPVDPDIAMKSLLSILNTVVMTPRPSNTPEAMLDTALDMLFQGIQNLPSGEIHV